MFLTRPRPRCRGFTLVELLVTLGVVALLLRLAAPSFSVWISNTKVRTVADALQNGLRLAETEAVRLNRQVVFSLTNDEPGLGSTATTDGKNWALHAVPSIEIDTLEFLQGGAFSDSANNATITGPAAICINSVGRLVGNTVPGVAGANCGAPSTQIYRVTAPGSDRPLQVTISVGGQIRMCDPARSLATSPDGC